MKSLHILLILCIFSFTTLLQANSFEYTTQSKVIKYENDSTFFQQKDKQKHILFFSAVGAIGANIAYTNGYSKQESWWIGLGSALLLGSLKEMYDKNFDMNDFAANALGGVIGSTSVLFRYEF